MKQLNKQQKSCRLRQGDNVMVMVGKSKGETGKVVRLDFKNQLVFVGGTNIYKRHSRPNNSNEEGGIIDKSMPMDWSNVQLIDPKTQKPTKISFKLESGNKQRIAKSSGLLVERIR